MMRKGQNTWARPSPQPDIIYVATGATITVTAVLNGGSSGGGGARQFRFTNPTNPPGTLVTGMGATSGGMSFFWTTLIFQQATQIMNNFY